MTEAVRIRQGTEADLDTVVAVGSACAEAPAWNREHYASMLDSGAGSLQRRVLLVGEVGSRVVGFAVAVAVAGQSELESVAVLLEARRQGIGRALCEAIMHWAKANGSVEMMLEVRSANVAAQAMYRSLGFTQTGLRTGYYSHPPDDAVLMAANLLVQHNL